MAFEENELTYNISYSCSEQLLKLQIPSAVTLVTCFDVYWLGFTCKSEWHVSPTFELMSVIVKHPS